MSGASGLLQHVREFVGRIPIDEQFARDVRTAIRDACASVKTHVYTRQQAERKLEETAKEAIVHVFQEQFPNSIKPFMVRSTWPYAECWIVEDEAFIRYSFSPETDAWMGGIAFEPLRIPIHRAPPGLMRRLWQGLKARRDEEAAPIGRPEEEADELLLDAPVEELPRPPAAPAKPLPPGMPPRTQNAAPAKGRR